MSVLRFAWATGLWSSVAENNQFTLQELSDFFASGSPSLRSFHIEEIIVIEPLGQALSIPLRFVNSFGVSKVDSTRVLLLMLVGI